MLLVLDPDAVPMGLVATRLRRRHLVVDVHEDYEKVADDRAWSRGVITPAARAAARLLSRLAARADITVVADHHLPPHQARKRLIVRNLPRADEIPVNPGRGRQPRAIYVGDLRPSRGLQTMIEAIAQSPGWTLDLVGSLSAPPVDALRRQLVEEGLVGRIRLHGRLPPDRTWALASGAWCGLSLLGNTPAYRDALPTKLFEYLAAGLPVISSDLPRSRTFLEATGAGRMAEDAQEVATILRTWSEDPSELDLLAEHASLWAKTSLRSRSDFDMLASEISNLLADGV